MAKWEEKKKDADDFFCKQYTTQANRQKAKEQNEQYQLKCNWICYWSFWSVREMELLLKPHFISIDLQRKKNQPESLRICLGETKVCCYRPSNCIIVTAIVIVLRISRSQ